MADGNQGSQSTGDGNENNQTSTDTQPKWIDQLPENLRDNENLTSFERIGDLGKAYIDLKGKYNENAILIPGEDASEEERGTFYKKLGRPDTADEYVLDGFEWPDEMPDYIKSAGNDDTKAIREIAHKQGLSQAQAKALHTELFSRTVDQWKQSQQAIKDLDEKQAAELKKEWGNDFDTNMETARRGFKVAGKLAGIEEKFTKFMDDSKLSLDMTFIKVFHAIGKAISEDSIGELTTTYSQGKEVQRDEFGRALLNFPSMDKK